MLQVFSAHRLEYFPNILQILKFVKALDRHSVEHSRLIYGQSGLTFIFSVPEFAQEGAIFGDSTLEIFYNPKNMAFTVFCNTLDH